LCRLAGAARNLSTLRFIQKMSQPFLLFDLDGTISDPIVGIWRSINYALEAFGFEPRSIEEISPFIGPPLDEIFNSLTQDPSITEEIIAKYRERFSEVGYSENMLYPGIREVIISLSDNWVSMGVCTSKRKDFAERILRMFDLHDKFEFVSGGDIGIKKYQQIESLLADDLIDQNTLMIGDRAIDLISAHRNGLQSVGVLWGYGSNNELEAESPKYIFRKPSELLTLVGSKR
jgi:phosphoglycolate phosphatase